MRDMKVSLALPRRHKIGGRINSSCSSSSASSITKSIRSSDENLTINEMMGKFDESYIYEKETDILSDSDPTDCDDRIDSFSDVDTGQDGGDENDPFENDFDYIDNAVSFLEPEKLDSSGRLLNNGHCAFFTLTNELSRRDPKLSFSKRQNKEERANHRYEFIVLVNPLLLTLNFVTCLHLSETLVLYIHKNSKTLK